MCVCVCMFVYVCFLPLNTICTYFLTTHLPQANDGDGTKNNSLISYSIIDNYAETFYINEMDGYIKINSTLDYEKDNHEINIKVMAKDHGIPSLNSTAILKITLEDKNDNPPEFSELVYNTKKRIKENVTEGKHKNRHLHSQLRGQGGKAS